MGSACDRKGGGCEWLRGQTVVEVDRAHGVEGIKMDHGRECLVWQVDLVVDVGRGV